MKVWFGCSGGVYTAEWPMADGKQLPEGEALTYAELAARDASMIAEGLKRAAAHSISVRDRLIAGRNKAEVPAKDMVGAFIASVIADEIEALSPAVPADEAFHFTPIKLAKHDCMRVDQGFAAGIETANALMKNWLSVVSRMGVVSDETLREVEQLATEIADKRPPAVSAVEHEALEKVQSAIKNARAQFYGSVGVQNALSIVERALIGGEGRG